MSDLSNVSNELKIVEIYDVIMFGICALRNRCLVQIDVLTPNRI